MTDWVSVKICRGTAGSAYGRSHKVEGSETFADLIEQIPEIDSETVSKVIMYTVYP